MKALIDGDILVYRGGFGSQETTTLDDGTRVVNAQPIAFALSNVKKIIQSILTHTGASDYKIYLTADKDNTNFRKRIATIKPYKGNRKAPRPYHYAAIRNYLVNKWNAEIVTGEEADDALGINQTEDTIICSIDKDLLMIPGKHYHIVKQTMSEISEKQALVNFYRQLLIGDSVDNIPGCRGIGKKRAEKIINLNSGHDYDMYRIVVGCYGLQVQKELGKDADWYLEVEPKAIERIKEIGRLLWIRRKPGEMWEPPKPKPNEKFMEILDGIKKSSRRLDARSDSES